jgi:cytochrome c oxidase subunit 2
MTAFLVVLVIILFGITALQMGKIFNMSKTPEQLGPSSEVANLKDNNINGWLMLGLAIFTYVLIIICYWKWGSVLLPKAASEHGVDIDNLFFITWVVIFLVGFLTLWLLSYFAFKYRGNINRQATFFADNDKLEFIWTIIPVIVLAGLIIYGLFTWTDIMNVGEDEDPMVIELYAYQFDWRARYSGDDNTLGEANVRLIEGTNQLGVDTSDPNAQDDVVVNELHLPVGQQVLFKMRSQDVLHSAYMPHFRAQMNCVPGMITQFSFTPTVTTEDMRLDDVVVAKVKKINSLRNEKSKELALKSEEGLEPYEFDYLLLCNKICGTNHYNMQMKIIVESQEEYEAWLATQPNIATSLKK